MAEITPNDSKNPQQTVQSDSQTQALPHDAQPQVESEQQAPAQAPAQDSAQPVPSQPQSYVQPHSYAATSPVTSTASQQPTNQQPLNQPYAQPSFHQTQPQQPCATQSGTQQPVNPAQNPFVPDNPQTAQSSQPFQSSDGLLHPQNASQQTTTSPLPGKSAIRALGKKTWGIVVGISLLCGLIGGAASAGIVTALTNDNDRSDYSRMQAPGYGGNFPRNGFSQGDGNSTDSYGTGSDSGNSSSSSYINLSGSDLI